MVLVCILLFFFFCFFLIIHESVTGSVGNLVKYTTFKFFISRFCRMHYSTVTCLSISNDEIAGARPEMNIKVAASVKA